MTWLDSQLKKNSSVNLTSYLGIYEVHTYLDCNYNNFGCC